MKCRYIRNNVWRSKKKNSCWRLQIAPDKIQRGDYNSYWGYKIVSQNIRPQKAQIRKDQLYTLNDFQRMQGDISHLQWTIGIGPDDLANLNKTLYGDKDLNSPRELSAEVERVLIEEKLQKVHVVNLDQSLTCILLMLPSKHYPTEF